MTPKNTNTTCLWFDGSALEAARSHARTFPDSAVGAVHHAPSDHPSGKQGNVLTVAFTVMGNPCLDLKGGPTFKHTEDLERIYEKMGVETRTAAASMATPRVHELARH